MNTPDPLILQKLGAFARRRRRLIILRGIMVAVAALVATMMVVALIDWIFVLPDWVRWSLSGLAYLSVLAVEWRSCVRLLLHAPDSRQLARLVEHAEPGLREDLLSAVELGQGDSAFDSPQFREMVQRDVATRMEGMEIDRLLPVHLVRRSAAVAGGILLLCLLVFTLTGFQFGTLFMRALLPMANLARVSKVQVVIVEPRPAEMTVPVGDTVPLLIQLQGQLASKAVLETFSPTGGREVIEMTAVGPDRFSAAIQVAREDVQYRVRAGDALTRKYQLKAAARPHVVRFHKTFRYPEYAAMPDKQVTEDSGDLVGLEGTEVDVAIEADQPLTTAELRLDQGKASQSIPLQSGSDGRMTARVRLNASGFYRVALTAAATGFENKFSPEYELRADPDLVPQVELEQPGSDLILAATDVLELRGTITDDQALAEVKYAVRVNTGGWKETVIASPLALPVKVAPRLDLYGIGVKPGDLVTVKLVAVDRKGSRGESRTRQISITRAGPDPTRITSLEVQRRLLEALKALRGAGEAWEKLGPAELDALGKLPEADAGRSPILARMLAGLGRIREEAQNSTAALQAALPTAIPGYQTAEQTLLGRLLARLDAGAALPGEGTLRAAAGEPATPWARDFAAEAVSAGQRASQRARMAEESFRTLLGIEEIDVLTEQFLVLAREQERVGELAQKLGGDPNGWSQFAGRLRVALAQFRGIEGQMQAAVPQAPGGSAERLKRLIKEMEKRRAAVEAAFADGEKPTKELLPATLELTKLAGEIRRNLLDTKFDALSHGPRVMNQLLAEVQPTWANFEKLRQDVEQASANDRLSPATRAALQANRWDARAAFFKTHGDHEEARPDSDAYFVSDVRAVTAALGAMQVPPEGATVPEGSRLPAGWPQTTEKLVTLDRSFRLLEGGHNVAEVLDGLTRLATAERWERDGLRMRTTAPRHWEYLEKRLRELPGELQRSEPAVEETRKIIQAANKLLHAATQDPATRAANDEMKERKKPDREPVAVPAHVERMAVLVKEALDLLRVPMQTARETVATMAPRLSETLKQLAREAEALKKENEAQAEQAKAKAPEEAQAEARRQLAAQEKLSEKVDAVRDELRSDANKQDVMKEEGRERARDADAALAMLREPPPRAEQALRDAAREDRPAAQEDALKSAATEQGKLASALEELAKHYDALEKGQKPEESRVALREKEKALGLEEALARQFAQAEQLEKMAANSPEELLKQLEKALPNNASMQQELSGLARNTLDQAATKLADASQRETSVAEGLQKLAQEQKAAAAQAADAAAKAAAAAAAAAAPAPAAPSPAPAPEAGTSPPSPAPTPASAPTPPSPAPAAMPAEGAPAPAPPQPSPQLAGAANQQPAIAQTAQQAGRELERAGRHEERLQNKAAGEALQKLGEEIRETATNEVAKAQQALEKAPGAMDAQAAVDAAAAELKAEVAQLAQTPGAPTPASGAPPAPAPSTPAGQQPATGSTPPSMQAGTPPGTPESAAPAAGTQPPAQTAQGEAPPAGTPGTPPPTGAPPAEGIAASPQQQVWMARTLDALDASINGEAAQAGQTPPTPGQPGQPSPSGKPGQPGQPGQPSPESLAQAQQAMQQAAQAGASEMRSARSQSARSEKAAAATAEGGEAAKSETGAMANAPGSKSGVLPGAATAATADWGRLPKQVAEQLSQGQREAVAGEYRNQVETYYRVIAERARKQ